MFFSVRMIAQISPGDLSKAHADLEGISNCTECHEIGEKVLSSKCLDCHKEIKSLVNSNRGYHSYAEVKKRECASCHNEHHGRNFRIVNFNENDFDHNKTGFKLTGAHYKKDCKDCHQSKFISDSKLKKKSKTHLGLDQKCVSCHEDNHQKTLGDDCGSCHNSEKFKPAANFDHNKSDFKLAGGHLKVECSKCHQTEKKNGKDFTKYKGLKFANCSACHSDVHKGAFGADCKSCHSVNGFNIINQQNFDHSKTKYPLIGKHQTVKCNDCHKGANKKKPLFAKCIDCHSDFHKGEFKVNGAVKDCNSCHSEKGFNISSFTLEEHNKGKFQLTGAHLAVPCKNCHQQEKEWKFKNVGLECISCHQNVHGTELAKKYLPENKCTSCHQTENWSTITFDHNSTEFVLLGKHKNVTCGKCHYTKADTDQKVFKFSSLNKNCEQCHKDVHFAQFREGKITTCEKCHAFNDWKPEKFDHNKTKFSLDNAHKKVPCIKCHPSTTENGNKFFVYKLKEFKCATCHTK